MKRPIPADGEAMSKMKRDVALDDAHRRIHEIEDVILGAQRLNHVLLLAADNSSFKENSREGVKAVCDTVDGKLCIVRDFIEELKQSLAEVRDVA